MTKRHFFQNLLLLFFIPVLLSACIRAQSAPSKASAEITEPMSPLPQNTPVKTQIIKLPESTQTSSPSLEALEGPIILLQTKVDEYHLVDLNTLAQLPYKLPGQVLLDSLASYQSPGSQYLLYLIEQEQFIRIDVLSNQVQTYNIPVAVTSNFDIERSMKTIQDLLPNQFMTSDGARFAVEESLRKSNQIVKWFQDDESILLVREIGPNGTYVFSYNLENGTFTQLEDFPGIIEDFWLSPGGDQILVKKGIVSQPNIWQDDQYLIVDLSLATVKPLPLPQNISNPSVFWVSDDSIGVIHQLSFAGGEFFSIINIANMESILIVPTSFSSIKSLNTHLLSIHKDQEAGTSTLKLWQMSGELLNSVIFQDICSYKSKVDSKRVLINCSQTSFLIEGESLSLSPLDVRISIFSRSPDRNYFILVTDSHQTYLVNPTFEDWNLLETSGDLLEVQWVPNSSGFLYRTATDLYHFDLTTMNNRYILTSDLFADYKNLNLIWIKTQ